MIETLLLRHFVTVAQLTSFSRAAEVLNTSQPVVSRNVKRLEEYVGTSLITRSTRTMALTAAGEALLKDALEVLGRLAVATDNARRIGDGVMAEVRLAICPTLETPQAVRGIAAFREQWPHVNLKLQALMSDLQPQALRSSEIDVGIMAGGAPSFEALKWHVLSRPWLGVALPRAWKFPVGKAVNLSALADRPIILPEREKAPRWYDGIMDMCIKAGFQPQIGGVVEDPVIARIMVSCGIGALFVPSRGENSIQGEVQFMSLAGDPVFLPGETVVAWADGANALQTKELAECLVHGWK